MVRAKVNWIRSHQNSVQNHVRAQASEKYHRYLRLARRYLDQPAPALIITHGLSGSGKTTLTQPVLEALGAIRVRSDIERKRLFQLPPGARTGAGIAEGIYSAGTGDRTYKRLKELASVCLQAGWPVIVDAAFLERGRRNYFRELAEKLELPFLILDFRAGASTLKARVQARNRAGTDASDADLAVLDHQLAHYTPMSATDAPFTLYVDTEHMSGDEIAHQVRKRITG
jgi:predicted kinase